MVKFYNVYPILQTVSAELSWSHYVELIEINNSKKRTFYQNKAIVISWSVRELRKQVKNNLFENTSKEKIEEVFKKKLPTTESLEVFQDSYHFQFIESLEKKTEKELEDHILKNIVKFLKTLGNDFTFADRQVPLKIDGETHFIDLVLFHKGIPCNILVDIKSGKLDSRDVADE